jgi:hypothetical protein
MTQICINHSEADSTYNKYPHAFKLACRIRDILGETLAPPDFVNVFTPTVEAYLAANNQYRIEVRVKNCAGAVYASGEAVEQADLDIVARQLSEMVEREVRALKPT